MLGQARNVDAFNGAEQSEALGFGVRFSGAAEPYVEFGVPVGRREVGECFGCGDSDDVDAGSSVLLVVFGEGIAHARRVRTDDEEICPTRCEQCKEGRESGDDEHKPRDEQDRGGAASSFIHASADDPDRYRSSALAGL